MEPAPTLSNAAMRWQQHILDQQRSGLNIAAYCRLHKLASSSFFVWRRKLQPADAPIAAQRFVPVTHPAASPIAEVGLPNGIVVKLPIDADPAQITRFITAVSPC